MDTEKINDRDGWRRLAWVIVSVIVAFLATMALTALGRVVRVIGTRLLIVSGTFSSLAGLLQSVVFLVVLAGPIVLGIIVFKRLIRSRAGSPEASGSLWRVFTPTVLVTAALLVLFASAAFQPPFEPLDTIVNVPPQLFYLGLVLVAVGVALFATDERLRTSPALGGAAGISSPAEHRAARPRRERSHLGAFTVGALFIVVAVLGLAGSFGLADVDVRILPALALTVLGVGLFFGTWVGRARWLTVLCVLMLPFVALASIIDVPVTGGVGRVSELVGSTGPLATSYHWGAGNLTLDLSNLQAGDSGKVIQATLVGGDLVVEIPRGLHVVVDASLQAGQIVIEHRHPIYRSGFDVQSSSTFGADSPGLVHVIVHCAVGTIRVLNVGSVLPSPTKGHGSSSGKGQ